MASTDTTQTFSGVLTQIDEKGAYFNVNDEYRFIEANTRSSSF